MASCLFLVRQNTHTLFIVLIWVKLLGTQIPTMPKQTPHVIIDKINQGVHDKTLQVLAIDLALLVTPA